MMSRSLFLAALVLLGGCATSVTKDLPLERLDADLARLAADDDINRYALADLREAQALVRQLHTRKDYSAADREHLVFIAERRMAIATARASKGAAEAELIDLEREKDRILLQASLEAAERSRLEAERLRRLTIVRAEEAERALAEAEQANEQSAQREREAELAKLQAEEALREAEERKRDAELARKEAELAAAEADALRQQLENLQVRRTDRGLVTTLSDVLFEYGEASLRPETLANLDKLVNTVEQYPDRMVNIEGHTDSRGTEQFNLDLSQQRAEAVVKALRERGVDSDRLRAVGLGEAFPVATNDTEFGRQKNRRVEVVILDQGQEG